MKLGLISRSKWAIRHLIEIVKNLITLAKTSFTNWRYYNKIKGKNIYFTIKPFQTGFTDQLRYFHAFYTIGKHLGLKYYHLPFEPKPLIFNNSENQSEKQNSLVSSQYNDIFDFMGFNQYFLGLNDDLKPGHFQHVEIVLDESIVNDGNIMEFREMEYFLKNEIINSFHSQARSVIINIKISNDQLLRWWIRSPLNQAFPGFDLLNIYNSFRKQNPWPLKFESGKIKMLIHIRQGDTAVVKTPWNTLIQVWGKKNSAFRELYNLNEINDNSLVTVSEFYSFYERLFKEFSNDEPSTLLFSDGFKRSFDVLMSRSKEFDLSEKQIEDIIAFEKTYDKNEFSVFDTFQSLQLFIGEDPDHLYDLLHSFIHSDVVIFGTQQRMIPKLIAFYFRYNNGPLAISLYHKKPQSYQILGKAWMEENFIFVDLDNYDLKEISSRISRFLEGRKKGKLLNT